MGVGTERSFDDGVGPEHGRVGEEAGSDAVTGCTVIVTVDAERRVLDDMEAHARLGLERFPSWTGFRSGILHRSKDGTRLIQRTEWASTSDYESCRDDAVWDTMPSTRVFFEHVQAGRALVDARQFIAVTRARQD